MPPDSFVIHVSDGRETLRHVTWVLPGIIPSCGGVDRPATKQYWFVYLCSSSPLLGWLRVMTLHCAKLLTPVVLLR